MAKPFTEQGGEMKGNRKALRTIRERNGDVPQRENEYDYARGCAANAAQETAR